VLQRGCSEQVEQISCTTDNSAAFSGTVIVPTAQNNLRTQAPTFIANSSKCSSKYQLHARLATTPIGCDCMPQCVKSVTAVLFYAEMRPATQLQYCTLRKLLVSKKLSTHSMNTIPLFAITTTIATARCVHLCTNCIRKCTLYSSSTYMHCVHAQFST
jgi:hypothetical protein